MWAWLKRWIKHPNITLVKGEEKSYEQDLAFPTKLVRTASEVLPCPFCGSQPTIYVDTDHSLKHRVIVTCHGDCPMDDVSVYDLQRVPFDEVNTDLAIFLWNTRSPYTK